MHQPTPTNSYSNSSETGSMTTMSYQGDHFNDETLFKIYERGSPPWPASILQTILDFCKENGTTFGTVLDIGCGSGFSIFPLQNDFDRLYGIDASAVAIERAKKVESKVDFRCGPAEDLSFLADGSVDLVTAGGSVHYMDQTKLNSHLKRVVTRNGVVACYTHVFHEITFHNQEADALLAEYMETTKPYAPSGYAHQYTKYRNIPSPFAHPYTTVRIDTRQNRSIKSICEFFHTLASDAGYRKACGNSDPLDQFRSKMVALFGSEETEVDVTVPRVLILTANN